MRVVLYALVLVSSIGVACSGSDAAPVGAGGSSGSSSGNPPSSSSGDPPSSSSGGTNDGGSDAPSSSVDPPLGGFSNGTGGTAPALGTTMTASGIDYRLIVPGLYAGAKTPLLVVYSGVEGGQVMTNNLTSLGPSTKTDGWIRAVLDGAVYNGNGQAGATVLDEMRAKYNIDNDRTYLIGESAGTTAALKLGFHIRQSYFAAYWANDVNATDTPDKNATTLGFAPWGQAGPGGDVPDATSIVNAMKAAGYRVPTPAPYDGPGATQHGNTQQFIAAMTWIADAKTRQ